MKEKVRKFLRPVLFTAAGMLAGLLYYFFVGCKGGSCYITSDPFRTAIYTGVIGWLLSGIFRKENEDKCNM